MVDRFDRLRHHAVVGGDDEDRDVGCTRATGTHRGERFVAGRVDERDRVPVVPGLIRADVLRDATCFAGDNVGVANRVEQRGLSVVDMTHHDDDRRTRLLERVVFVVIVAEQRLQLELGFLAGLDEQHVGAERLGDQLDHLVGEGLRARDHLAGVEQQPNEVGRRTIQLRRELLDRDTALDHDLVLGDGRVARRELGHRCGAEVLEVATTPLAAPRPLALRAGPPAGGAPRASWPTLTGTTASAGSSRTTTGATAGEPTASATGAAATGARREATSTATTTGARRAG